MKAYYEQDGVTIYHGDARDVLPELESGCVIVTDPPYGTGQKIAYDVYKDTMKEWLPLMEWLLSIPLPTAFTMSHSRLFDLPKRPQWVGCWDKQCSGGIVHVGASPSWEPICFYNLPAGDRGKPRWDDIFRFMPSGYINGNIGKQIGHPCPKPVGLYKRLIRVMAQPGTAYVVDPMMGSGTTLRAAKDMGLFAVGCDVSEKYCEIAAKRMSQSVLPMEFTAQRTP